MLNSLSIKNVVLIDELELNFESGLSVLTGETGAGKSILLDSLGLVLGSRAETSLIRQGEEKLQVLACFDLPSKEHPIFELAKEYDIELEDEIIIKRSLSRDGKGKIFINEQSVTQKFLKDFGALLVEVHGQFDNHGLLNQANHRGMLDSYGRYDALLSSVRESFELWNNLLLSKKKLEVDLAKSKQEEDNLKHWVDELQKLKPLAGEESELAEKRTMMMNAEKILDSLNYAYSSMLQNGGVVASVRQAQSAIDKANRTANGKYEAVYEQLEQALLGTEEALSMIEEASKELDLNRNEADYIEQRLFALKAAARKHQSTIDDLPNILEKMQNQLKQIEHGEDNLEDMIKQEQIARKKYIDLATMLSNARKKAASELDAKVMVELPALKMEKANFVTIVEPLSENVWGENGFDAVNFTVSTNPNSPQAPLSKIASGGELARFMLALKVNLAGSSSVMTMIFDELDAGVGGATAQAVGERLYRLAEKAQVLLVTHSPQVAACGMHHFKVEKKTKDNITTTYVDKLSSEAKFEEIARMLAGQNVTDEARAAARVLIKRG